jgi:hypothetical protein
MKRVLASLALSVFLWPVIAAAQWNTQKITLQPGWNGVQLLVQPAQAECDEVFSNTPVAKVFWWQRTGTGMEFDLDPQNPFPRTADWQYWFATNQAVSTFGSLLAGESYEIFVATNAVPFTLQVKGKPVLNATRWIPGEQNLAGFPVSTNNSPSFVDFFSFSSDFVMNSSTATVFRITGLSNTSTSQRVWNPATQLVRSGEACWIVAGANARDYGGPIQVKTESSRLLDFGSSVSPRNLIVKNFTPTNRTVQIAQLASENPPVMSGISTLIGKTPLLFKVASSDGSYLPMPDLLETNIAGMGQLELSLAPDPQALTNGTAGAAWQSIIRVTDANNSQFANATVTALIGVSCDGSVSSLLDPQGLWVGQATVTDVERAPTREGGVVDTWASDGPVPVSRPFTFRVIFHVDSAGNARLLQRALVAWQPSTSTADPLSDPSTNGVMAIMADEAKAKTYATQHPDAKIARVSSPCFPLMDPVNMKTGGVFGATGSLSFDVTIPYNDPVNPFVHRYHPQHDNLQYDNGVAVALAEGVESYTVTRAMEFHFDLIDPSQGTANRRWGVTENGGRFNETVTGLNKTIRVAGTFKVERVSRVGELTE